MDEMAGAMPEQLATPPSARARLLDADWRAVGSAVLPILLALLVGSQLAALTAWVAGDTSSDGLSVGAYLSALTMIACSTFFGGLSASNDTEGDGFALGFTVHAVPLGITVLVLATAWFAIKRSARGDRRERQEFAARVSVVLALVVLALALLSRIDTGLGDGDGTVHANVVESVIGALALMLGVTLLAARGGEPRVTARLGAWAAPVRGAVTGLIGACLLGFLAGLVAISITVAAYDGSLLDVARGLPLALAFLPNVGLAVAHLSLLGTVDASFAAFFGGGDNGVGLLARHGASAWYLLLVVIAPVIITVAIVRALRAAEPADDAAARRVAYRVAAPLAVGWVVLGLLSRVRVGTFGIGSSVGPTVWQTLVLPAVWTAALGYLLGGPLRRLAGRRPARPTRSPMPLSTLCLGFTVASVLLAGGAAAGAQRESGAGPFGLTDSVTSSGSASVGAVTTPSGTGSSNTPHADLHALIEDVGKAEQTYHADHGEYTTDLAQLRDYGLRLPDGVDWSASGVDGAVCVVVSTEVESWTFDSADPANPVQPGDHC